MRRAICTVVSAFVLTTIHAGVAAAQYITDWELRAFITEAPIVGQVIEGTGRWTATFASDGEFKFVYTNRTVKRGRWHVAGRRLHFMFSNGEKSCRSIILVNGVLEWQDCDTRVASSRIVSPGFDPSRYAGLNARKSAEAAAGMAGVRGVIGAIPFKRGALGPEFVREFINSTLDNEIMKHLDEAQRHAHADAMRRALSTGDPAAWESNGSRGRVTPGLHKFTNVKGHYCETIEETIVTVDGTTERRPTTWCWDENGKPTQVG